MKLNSTFSLSDSSSNISSASVSISKSERILVFKTSVILSEDNFIDEWLLIDGPNVLAIVTLIKRHNENRSKTNFWNLFTLQIYRNSMRYNLCFEIFFTLSNNGHFVNNVFCISELVNNKEHISDINVDGFLKFCIKDDVTRHRLNVSIECQSD